MTAFIRSLVAATLVALPAAANAQEAPVLAVITHPVADYAKWRQAYDDFADRQKAGGVIMEQVYRDPDNPKMVMVLHGFETSDAARRFLGSEALKTAMQGAGVTAPPQVTVMSRAD